MPKPIKNLRASTPVAADAKRQWLVLIGDSGETSADDIEAFFADIWPDVEPEDGKRMIFGGFEQVVEVKA